MTEPLLLEEAQLREAVRSGVVAGMRELAADEKFVAMVWAEGFKHLAAHSSNGASQWIGKRLLTSFVVAVTTAGLIWLAKSGNLK